MTSTPFAARSQRPQLHQALYRMLPSVPTSGGISKYHAAVSCRAPLKAFCCCQSCRRLLLLYLTVVQILKAPVGQAHRLLLKIGPQFALCVALLIAFHGRVLTLFSLAISVLDHAPASALTQPNSHVFEHTFPLKVSDSISLGGVPLSFAISGSSRYLHCNIVGLFKFLLPLVS